MIITYRYAKKYANFDFYIANIAVFDYTLIMTTRSYKNEYLALSHAVTDGGERNTVIHCHNWYEILYFMRGDVVYYIEGQEYTPRSGGLLLIPPGTLHGVKACGEDTYQRYVMSVYPEKLTGEARFLLQQAFRRQSYYENTDRFGIDAAFDDVFKTSELGDFAATVSAEALIAKIVYIQKHADESGPSMKASDTLAQIITYINGNFSEPITLDSISAHFFISKHHLNKVFRKATGTTVGEYIIYKRVYYAKSLIQSGMRVGEAAMRSGFSDYSAFYRAYTKRIGNPPKENKTL